MQGRILQVSTSHGGIPKRAVDRARITFNGLEGDRWTHPQYHGGPDQKVLLIAGEALDLLRTQGFPVYPGALGENLTTTGLDISQWRIGQKWRAGSSLIEFAKLRVPCNTIKVYGEHIARAIFDARVRNGDYSSPVWARSGIYARVIEEGVAAAGDPIELISESA